MGRDSAVSSFGVEHHGQSGRAAESQDAIKNFRDFVSVRFHRVAVIARLHVNINACKDVSQRMHPNGDIDDGRFGCARQLLLPRRSVHFVAGTVEHLQNIVHDHGAFFVTASHAATKAVKQSGETCLRGFHDLKSPNGEVVVDGESFTPWRFHRFSEQSPVLLEFDLRVTNHGLREPLLQGHADAVGQIVGFIDDDDDVFKGQSHGFET